MYNKLSTCRYTKIQRNCWNKMSVKYFHITKVKIIFIVRKSQKTTITIIPYNILLKKFRLQDVPWRFDILISWKLYLNTLQHFSSCVLSILCGIHTVSRTPIWSKIYSRPFIHNIQYNIITKLKIQFIFIEIFYRQ